MSGLGAAAVALLAAAALAAWNLYLTRRQRAPSERITELERKHAALLVDLRNCRRVNRWLRHRNELVAMALLRLLPERDRLDLLGALDDRVTEPPPAAAVELDDDVRRWLEEDDE